jgi:Peptidase_C39 like family
MSHALVRWDADAIAAWEREAPTPDDDPLARVALLSPQTPTADATELIPSWGAFTPPDTWVELQLRAQVAGRWGKWYRVAAWDSAPQGSRRTSFDEQADADGKLATDTLILAAPAQAAQARVLLCAEPGADMPELESLALCLTAMDQAPAPERSAPVASPPSFVLRPSSLPMPLLLSQYLTDPEQGHRWCSPTAMTMLLAYWHAQTGDDRLVPYTGPEALLARAVPLIYDPGWEGTGNWPFNTALAAALGLTAYVTRLHSFAQLARWVAAGVPVPISIRWKPGQLEGAIGSGNGHIAVVRGFEGGRVLMAEPASHDTAAITRSYDAGQLYACWQQAGAAVYIVHPTSWPRPEPGAGDAWA